MTHARQTRPIGVFDSGAGGLTVLEALRRRMPRQDFIYVADTLRVPYGRKPRRMVAQFAAEIAGFLENAGVQGIVIACNTASAAALPALQDTCSVPVWGVIEPGVRAAVRATRSGWVGVIGTAGAIASEAYQSRLRARGFRVWARPCPLFVHLVEERLTDCEEAELLARYYLGDRPPIDTLILGCTHYPYLRRVIRRVAGPDIHLVDSAAAAAEAVLEEAGAGRGSGRVTYYVTGDPAAFEDTAAAVGSLAGKVVHLASLARGQAAA
jgi:glutamate racemase